MRWHIADNNTIEWNVGKDTAIPHADSLEMSGLRTSLIVDYGVNEDRTLFLKRRIVWPALRVQPNQTHDSFQIELPEELLPCVLMNENPICEQPEIIRFNGILEIHTQAESGLKIVHHLFPSVTERCAADYMNLTNTGVKDCKISVTANGKEMYRRGCTGMYIVTCFMSPCGDTVIHPGETVSFTLSVSARIANEPMEFIDGLTELRKREDRVNALMSVADLKTGIPELDLEYRLAKVRAGESIFLTRGGLMHSPGGFSYYAATWCNDQVEYAGPWFAFTGDKTALEASFNAYRHYIPFMGPDYQPIPSSVIAEGFDYWNGAGDRGDAAMYAYGASRFLLVCGHEDYAKEIWFGIQWALEYCRRKLNEYGVVSSDSDELEGRLPSGAANLCTSSLYYGGLQTSALVAEHFGWKTIAEAYRSQAKILAENIESYFGADLHGFQTYRYYKGCEVLRSWIGIPLCMGITDRASETVNAMFSPCLWNGNGMYSAEGDTITWDRSLLYGFRGALAAGYGDAVFDKLKDYARSRLLGEHVPYPVEAWPEGNRRHLSAESALFCRIITEGLFGITPSGFGEIQVHPYLPKECSQIRLHSVKVGGKTLDIRVKQQGKTEITSC